MDGWGGPTSRKNEVFSRIDRRGTPRESTRNIRNETNVQCTVPCPWDSLTKWCEIQALDGRKRNATSRVSPTPKSRGLFRLEKTQEREIAPGFSHTFKKKKTPCLQILPCSMKTHTALTTGYEDQYTSEHPPNRFETQESGSHP